jgi:hypothetical protein
MMSSHVSLRADGVNRVLRSQPPGGPGGAVMTTQDKAEPAEPKPA